jgi:transglutaminase-like putative cysteine protease
MAVRPRFTANSIGRLQRAVNWLASESLLEMRDPKNRGLIPPLYGGKIRYLREQPGHEDWQTALETARLGTGDCEDLAAYRVAELRGQGVPAEAVVTWINPHLRHVTVRYSLPDGRVMHEDPSKRLGM